jgi:predicted nuclease with TOPRIM domain
VSQEKKLLENELSDMVIRYDNIKVDNDSLRNKLQQSKLNVAHILDSIKTLQPSASLLSLYRSKINLLQKENAAFLNVVSTLKTENNRLASQNEAVTQNLKVAKNNTSSLSTKNKGLATANAKMSTALDKASLLSIASLDAKAVKRVTKKRIVSTSNASKANKLYVSFTLDKNKLATTGVKDLYIQILNPNNNVVADQGSISFGEQSLIFSKKIKVDYKNEAIDVNTLITTDLDEPLTKGVYFVNVFYDNTRLGSTSIMLK